MALKWYGLLEKNLELGDKIIKIYEGKLDGKSGYLCLSKRKLLFAQEKGFMRNNYDLTLNLTYDQIVTVFGKGGFNLIISETGGREYKFYAFDVPASIIERSFEELTYVSFAHNYL